MTLERGVGHDQGIKVSLEVPSATEGPLTYEQIMQREDVRSAKTLQEQDRIILNTYRQSKEEFIQRQKSSRLSTLREHVIAIFN